MPVTKQNGVGGVALVRELLGQNTTQTQVTRFKGRDELIACIQRHAHEPVVSFGLVGQELLTTPLGSMIMLNGPTGSGKSSLALCLALNHANHAGPALVSSLELDDFEAGARALGTCCDTRWLDALHGRIDPKHMREALPPRFFVLGRDGGIVDIEAAVSALQSEFADQPLLLVIDYVQLLTTTIDGEDRDIRTRVGRAMRELDRIARARRIVLLIVSQTSRASARSLRSGESLGAATTDAGAESSDLERWSTATLAIGGHGAEAADGSSPVDVSIGKARFGGGDRVIPARFFGATGRWVIVGDARSAADVRAERSERVRDTKVNTLMLAAQGALANAREPMSRRELLAKVGGKNELLRRAVDALLADRSSGVVEVHPRRNGHFPLWTRVKAVESGRRIAESEEVRDGE